MTAPVADLVVVGGDIVTMDPERRVLTGGAVAVAGGAVVDLGAPERLRREHPLAPVLDATGCVVTPGLVDAHQHCTGDPLVRSCIPDLVTSDQAIFEWAVPIHAVHSPDDDALSATLTALECLRSGTTTVVEAGTVAHPERVAAAMVDVGIRGTIGCWGWDEPDAPYAAPAEEVLARQADLLERYPPGGQVEAWVTLVGHALASDDLLAGAAALARARAVPMTMHLSPSSADPETYLDRTGRRPVEHLAALGVLGPHLVLAHAVWLDDAEVALVLGHDVAIAYCPWAYLRLGQGVTVAGRHAEIIEAGGRVALGCDAANAADHHDVLATAALAAGLARDTRISPTRFGAHTAFELATVAGAGAIGMGERIGSLEVGKAADLVVFDARGVGWAPRGDVGLQLVWGGAARSVRDVVVAGEVVVRDGRSTRVDEASLVDELAERQRWLLDRAGIAVADGWPRVEPR